MNQQIAGNNLRKIRVLVAPLDWGLGHATRCIPIINELLNLGCEPWIAAESAQHSLLKLEFPSLNFIPLDGYRVRYSISGPGLTFAMIFQSGKILKAIKNENEWLKKIIKEYDFAGVISDNRFGLYHEKIPCVFITHQLRIKSPLGKFSERILQNKNYKSINKFQRCWIPDFENPPGLAGELSHPEKMPGVPVEYIGPLTRFSEMEGTGDNLLILLSGPEPQRTLLENAVVSEIADYRGKATIIRGLPGNERLIPSTNSIRFYNHLPTSELNRELANASLVISRSGYTTVMDVVSLGKKAVFVPTPGQTEQLYLSRELEQSSIAPSLSQRDFSISKALEVSTKFNYIFPKFETSTKLSSVVGSFVASLSTN